MGPPVGTQRARPIVRIYLFRLDPPSFFSLNFAEVTQSRGIARFFQLWGLESRRFATSARAPLSLPLPELRRGIFLLGETDLKFSLRTLGE